MGKKPAQRRKGGVDDGSENGTSPPLGSRAAKDKWQFRRTLRVALPIILLLLMVWRFTAEADEAVAPEFVRGPADAVEELCTTILSPSTAAELALHPAALPSEAVARVCFSPPQGRLLVVDGFLSAAEIVHMRELVHSSIHRAKDHSQPGYRCVHATGLQYPKGLIDEDGARTERLREDVVLN